MARNMRLHRLKRLPARRVPQSYPPAYVRAKLLPLIPTLAAAIGCGAAAELPLLPEQWREAARTRSDALGTSASERSQRIFFDEPGLDTLFVRSLSSIAGSVSRMGKAAWRLGAALTRNDTRARRILPLIPTRGYDALMTAMLTVGTATGAMRGGPVHAQAIRDSNARPQSLPAPDGHAAAQLRRVDVPRDLKDMCADIDDLYWSMTDGHTVKITRVGAGSGRRWLVSLPGTANMDFHSTANPADMESNIREMIGLESAMRIGTVRAIHDAMRRDGIPSEQWAIDPVLVCGHSQGGIIAVALASMPPERAGVNVRAILATGSPCRRIRLRPDVTMVSVAHDQDVIPSMDGTPTRSADQRVSVGRSLVRPRTSPLYYAHSSATYTQTVRILERKAGVTPWGPTPTAVAALRDYFPAEDEDVRVFFYELWQDILEPTESSTVDTFVALDRAEDFSPVDYDSEWAPSPLVDLPALPSIDIASIPGFPLASGTVGKHYAGTGAGPKSRVLQQDAATAADEEPVTPQDGAEAPTPPATDDAVTT